MVRPSQRLYPAREVKPARPAATMLLLRDSPEGPEVLMTRRADAANFAAGAYVFPGGALDAADVGAHAIARHRPGQHGLALTQAVAAIRECFEEMGVLLAYRADGAVADAADVALLDREPPAGESFASQCAARGLTLAADRLRHFARWIADPNNPKRFDTAFFVVRMPAGQVPVADDREQFEPVWVRPAEALARHRTGRFFMIFPTIRTLELLAAHASVDDVLAACAAESPRWHNETRSATRAGEVVRLTSQDEGYGEVALIAPHGEVVPPLEFPVGVPVPLLQGVSRLTAPDGTHHYEVEAGLARPVALNGAAALLLEEDGVLITGPGVEPDAALLALCRARGIEFVLPERGHVRMVRTRPDGVG
jgi:8-oxo-dGTP pyrophosphatase MutT (NUDIX family)